MPYVLVDKGECMDSIAVSNGFLWDALWNLPENAELKAARKDPFVLLEGDRVYVPSPRQLETSRATDKAHRFVLRGASRLRLQLLDDDQPIAGEPFALTVDGTARSGTTDSDGWINEPILPNAQVAELRLQNGTQWRLCLGGLNPVSELSGVRARLQNLGFECSDDTDPSGPKTTAALRAFQAKHGLEKTGVADEATRDKLLATHKC